MHNLRGDQGAKLGLTYTDLAPSNPEIVCVHISACGSAPKPARRCASLCAGFASGPATPTSHGPTAPGRLRSRSRLFHASEGERSDWPGFDYLMQAEAGFFSLTGEPEGPPARFGLSMIDYMTGATTSTAILAGILGARKSGRGRDIDVTLYDVAMYQLTHPGA